MRIDFHQKLPFAKNQIFEGRFSAKIDFYNINDMNKIDFDKDVTNINYRKRNFVYDFLSSMRQKVNDPLGKRKKGKSKY